MTDSREDGVLRYAAIAFMVTVAIHGGDHFFRGIEDQSPQVVGGGTLQFILGALAVLLVFRRHRAAPTAAIVVGFASALLFSAAHLLPTWGAFSDSYVTPETGAGVTWFSWVTALLEISADLFFGWAGVRAPRRASTEQSHFGEGLSA